MQINSASSSVQDQGKVGYKWFRTRFVSVRTVFRRIVFIPE
jgi:hypothetical protein